MISQTEEMIDSLPLRIRPKSDHLFGLSLGSIAVCVILWIRAKAIGEDERANAERRALLVGLWPPTLWLMGESMRRAEEREERASRRLLGRLRG